MYIIKAVDITTTATMCVTGIYITKHNANYIVSLENKTGQYPSWKEFTVHYCYSITVDSLKRVFIP